MKKIFCLFMVIVLTTIGCGTNASYVKSRSSVGPYSDVGVFPKDEPISSIGVTAANTEHLERVVLYSGMVSLIADDPDSVNAALTEIVNRYGGYIKNLGYTKSVIRVRSSKLHDAMNDITLLGKVKSKTVSGDDITEQYVDVQIRLDNARKSRERYLELLAKAENVDAALKVEKELERLNGEIEALEGRMNNYSHLLEYSTINVYIEKKVKPGIIGYVGIGLYKSVRWLFVRN